MRRIILYGAFFVTIPFVSNAQVIINEIAWMGTSNSANDEWIELLNTSDTQIDLTGWMLEAVDGTPSISFDGLTIIANGFLLLERTDDESVPGVTADLIYTGALSNSGEHLSLKNNGSVVDSINATDGWPAGDNSTKETMQRNGNDWTTALATPKEANGFGGASESTTEETQQGVEVSTEKIYSGPVEYPTIHVFGGEDRNSVAGGELIFEARALGWKDEPLGNESVRYTWNFGDGAKGEGVQVKHSFSFPGGYTVIVTASHNDYFGSVSDTLRVTVTENQTIISTVDGGAGGRIELHNPSSETIELSNWILFNEKEFRLPLNTFIGAGAQASYAAEVTGINIAEKEKTELRYPNNRLAYKYEEETVEPEVILVEVMPLVIEEKVVTPKEVDVIEQEPMTKEEEIKKEIPLANISEPVLLAQNKDTNLLWFLGSLVGGGILGFFILLFRRKMGLWSSS
ncbi:MAG: lamin tail domain-containing protein [bacterium]|nr:lamin tail domain-containing protein [bacterium]